MLSIGVLLRQSIDNYFLDSLQLIANYWQSISHTKKCSKFSIYVIMSNARSSDTNSNTDVPATDFLPTVEEFKVKSWGGIKNARIADERYQ